MAHAVTLWFGRFFSSAARLAPVSKPSAPKVMKIEVESLPDYLWRELGFLQPRRLGEDR